jgi:phenylacetate-coenzyme A ligase PaaK-like adenylate-forming protein
MNLVHAYHRMPFWMRCLAATARGIYLQRWRYGDHTDRLVEEALERETWSAERWNSWQQEQLAYVLHRAATRVPYYRDLWSRRRATGYTGSWEILENWPLLQKEDLRSHACALVADDINQASMFHEHSSGSTGTPLNLWQSRRALQLWYALFEARWRKWYGLSRRNRWAILGGQLVTPVSQKRPPFWVWNAAMRQLYMSSYHLSPAHIPYYIDAIKRYRIEYIWGYSSSLYTFAQGLLDKRFNLQMQVAITNAEPLLDYQRDVIAAAFRCSVKETYGMSEMVAAASECEFGTLHLWPEIGYIELQSEGYNSNGEVTGEMICTGLCNPDMPLIRYRIGDRATFPVNSSPCPCQRTLPVLLRIEGRSDDMLFSADQAVVGRLDPVFKGDFLIREAQIIQESLVSIRLLYVPATGFTEKQLRALINEIRARIGDVRVEAECVAAIPRGPNNKFRAVICKLPADQRRSLMQARIKTNATHSTC